LSAAPGNDLIISTHYDAVRLPQFAGKAPQVLVQRVTLAGTNINALTRASSANCRRIITALTPVVSRSLGADHLSAPTIGQACSKRCPPFTIRWPKPSPLPFPNWRVCLWLSDLAEVTLAPFYSAGHAVVVNQAEQ